ncbi:MAG: hypothetical protein R3281_17410 [Balneolaceae bacterium]|nr:hypothetical protein [Balneolaceae bacterium]
MMRKNYDSIGYYILVILMFFQGLSGTFGGAVLMLDPSGALIQLPPAMLEGTPFPDFLIPGIILFTILGFFPLAVAVGLWKKWKWSWFGALLVSVALIIWIEVEIILVGYQPDPPLQLIYGLVGLLLLILVLLPPVKRTLV